ncbi:MbtH family protein [Streptomyces sp. NPDC002044]|uniref:MbtH family protein n=1 Tax=Streptomyces sp. NPDC002044 TaxID=3154662 RepID=UPI003332285A
MANPFDDESGTFLVLVNGDNQHSLWPARHAVPAGWDEALSATTRQSCVNYIERHWTDLRPARVVAHAAGVRA